MSQFQSGGSPRGKKTADLRLVPSDTASQPPSVEKKSAPRLIFVGEDRVQLKKAKKFAKNAGFDFYHYSESEWATLEEIDQYIQDEELSKQTIHLPAGRQTVASLDEIEAETIKKALQNTNGNVLKTCRVLKIARATLYRKMERHGLSLKREREQQLKKYEETVKNAS